MPRPTLRNSLLLALITALVPLVESSCGTPQQGGASSTSGSGADQPTEADERKGEPPDAAIEGQQDAAPDAGGVGDGGTTAECTLPKLSDDQAGTPAPGPRVVTPGEFYVMYSTLLSGGRRFETSNTFILRGVMEGAKRLVWVFGSGYGDGLYLSQFPGREAQRAERSGAQDAQDVDTVIRQCMGLRPEDAAVRFIAPHGHGDHINQEFLAALVALGHQSLRASIHMRDLDAVTCQACEPHSDPPLSEDIKARLEVIGKDDDQCDDEVMRFDTAALGEWVVTADDERSHTPGVVNLDSPSLGVRLAGSKLQDFCTRAPYDGAGDVRAVRASPDYAYSRSGLFRVHEHGKIDGRHLTEAQ